MVAPIREVHDLSAFNDYQDYCLSMFHVAKVKHITYYTGQQKKWLVSILTLIYRLQHKTQHFSISTASSYLSTGDVSVSSKLLPQSLIINDII